MTPRPKQVSRFHFICDSVENQIIRELFRTIYGSQDDKIICTAMYDLAELELRLGRRPAALLSDLEAMRPGRALPTGQILREAAEALGMGGIL